MIIEAKTVGEVKIIDSKYEEVNCGYVTVPMRFMGLDDDGEVVYTSPVYAVRRWGAGTRCSVYEAHEKEEVPFVIEVLKAISASHHDTGGRMNAFLDSIWDRYPSNMADDRGSNGQKSGGHVRFPGELDRDVNGRVIGCKTFSKNE